MPEEDLAGAARFLRIARSLITDALEIRSHKLSLAEWAALIGEFVGRYIDASEPADEAVCDRCLGSLEPMGALFSEPVSYEVAQAFASTSLAESGVGRNGLFGRVVAVGSLATFRQLPFRAIFVMGLGSLFRNATGAASDLRLTAPSRRYQRARTGQISVPEAILRRAIKSLFVGRYDPNTGDALPFPHASAGNSRSYLESETLKG